MTAKPLSASQRLPHAELWTPPRAMLNDTLPLISHHELLLDRLKTLSARRHETAGMRRLWHDNYKGNYHRPSQSLNLPDKSQERRNQTAPAVVSTVKTVAYCPKIKVSTLSPEWLHEIQKKVGPRMEYTTKMEVKTDREAIKRRIMGKFFTKNASQTHFLATFPRYQETYSIHPEFDSEYQKCWTLPKPSDSRPSSYASQRSRVKTAAPSKR